MLPFDSIPLYLYRIKMNSSKKISYYFKPQRSYKAKKRVIPQKVLGQVKFNLFPTKMTDDEVKEWDKFCDEVLDRYGFRGDFQSPLLKTKDERVEAEVIDLTLSPPEPLNLFDVVLPKHTEDTKDGVALETPKPEVEVIDLVSPPEVIELNGLSPKSVLEIEEFVGQIRSNGELQNLSALWS